MDERYGQKMQASQVLGAANIGEELLRNAGSIANVPSPGLIPQASVRASFLVDRLHGVDAALTEMGGYLSAAPPSGVVEAPKPVGALPQILSSVEAAHFVLDRIEERLGTLLRP